jgi:hypothetical protein
MGTLAAEGAYTSSGQNLLTPHFHLHLQSWLVAPNFTLGILGGQQVAKLIREKFKILKSTKWASINLTAVEDPNLSPKAKWIHTYMLSRPPSWEIRIRDIINKSTAGRDAIYSGLKELEENKYIHRKRIYKNGRIVYWLYEVNEKPTEKPPPEKLVPEKPEQENLLPGFQDQENPHNYYYNNNNSQHKTLSKERVIPEASSGLSEKTHLLRIKRRRKKNNKGLFYSSDRPRRYKTTPLNSWNQHPLNKNNKYDPPVIALQDKIKNMRIKRPAYKETEEVINYWNKVASQLSNNGHKLPTHRLDLDTKTSYMCKLIVTGILHTSELTVEDIKKAIDNYTKILENSHYYHHLYTFPQFYSKAVFSDCIEGNLSSYIKYKRKLTKDGLLDIAESEHRLFYGKKATIEEIDLYKRWIQEGEVTTEEDAKRCVL